MEEHEKQIALMEAELAATEDAFFAARHEIDTLENRNVFGAGFRRAWAYLKAQAANAEITGRMLAQNEADGA